MDMQKSMRLRRKVLVLHLHMLFSFSLFSFHVVYIRIITIRWSMRWWPSVCATDTTSGSVSMSQYSSLFSSMRYGLTRRRWWICVMTFSFYLSFISLTSSRWSRNRCSTSTSGRWWAISRRYLL